MGGNSHLAHPSVSLTPRSRGVAWGAEGGWWLFAQRNRAFGPDTPCSGPSGCSGAGAIWSRLYVHLAPSRAFLSHRASGPAAAEPSTAPKPLQPPISVSGTTIYLAAQAKYQGITLEFSLSLPTTSKPSGSVCLRNIRGSVYFCPPQVPPLQPTPSARGMLPKV